MGHSPYTQDNSLTTKSAPGPSRSTLSSSPPPHRLLRQHHFPHRHLLIRQTWHNHLRLGERNPAWGVIKQTSSPNSHHAHTETLIASDYTGHMQDTHTHTHTHTHTFQSEDSRLLYSFSSHSFDYGEEQADSLSSSYPVQEWACLWCALSIPFIFSTHCSVLLSALSTEKTMLVHNAKHSLSYARYVIHTGSKSFNPKRFQNQQGRKIHLDGE